MPIPGLCDSLSLPKRLFQSTFGCKRLAPGEIQEAHTTGGSRSTLAHDATALGGNSVSVIVFPGTKL